MAFAIQENYVYKNIKGQLIGPLTLTGRTVNFPWKYNGRSYSGMGRASGNEENNYDLIEEIGPLSFKPNGEAAALKEDAPHRFVIVRETLQAMTLEQARATVLTQKIVGARICKIIEVASQEISLKTLE